MLVPQLLIGIALGLPFSPLEEPPNPNLTRGNELLLSGDFRQAADEFEKVAESSPDNVEAYFLAGYSNFLLGNQRKARRFYSHALAIDPDHEGAAFWLRVSEDEKDLRRISTTIMRSGPRDAVKQVDRYLQKAGTDVYWRAYLRRTIHSVVLKVYILPVLAVGFAEKGNLQRAEQLIDIWQEEFPEMRSMVDGLRGEIAVKQGDIKAARTLRDEYSRIACKESKEILWIPKTLLSETNGELEPPKPVKMDVPAYTDSALTNRISGTQIFVATINAEGRVEVLALASRPLGHGLEEQAIQTIEQSWRFQPANCGDASPKAVWVTIEVSYKLRGS